MTSEDYLMKEVAVELDCQKFVSPRLKIELADERKRKWKEKALHVQYFRDVQEVASDQSWDWLKNGRMKRETESLVCAAQDQALHTNAIKSKIYKENISPLCRLCNKYSETVMHLVSGCEILAQKDYKKRHDKLSLHIHWLLCCKYD